MLRSFALFLLSLCFASFTFAQAGGTPKAKVSMWERFPELATMLRVPNLNPQLTKAEVATTIQPWSEKIRSGFEGLTPDQATKSAKYLQDAREALQPVLSKVKSITLYSLNPYLAKSLRDTYYEPRAAELEKLPRFYDYPILGSVTIREPAEVERWMTFLRAQVWPGGFAACDFMPRHGFRFSSDQGDEDMLMCFSCDQLGLPSGKKFEYPLNPIFSIGVRDVVNALFDKKKIERDKPKRE